MLTAETLVTRVIKGYSQQRWERIGRNEALDCRVGALAAAWILGMHRLQPDDWRAMAQQRGLIQPAQSDLIDSGLLVAAPPPAPLAVRAAGRSGFVPATKDWF